MADIALMELWLDRKKLDTLEEALAKQGSCVEASMQEFFLDLYAKMVPLSVQEKIEEQLRAEAARMAENAADYRKRTAYRVTAGGKQHCFQTDIGSDILMTAFRLKEYLSGPSDEGFQSRFPEQKPVSADQFSQLAMRRMDGEENIVGVYDVDFDRGELSFIEPAKGWQTFPMDSVYTAVCRTERKQGLSHEQSRVLLMKNLDGWAVLSPGHLSANAIAFEGNIEEASGHLIFQMEPGDYFESLDPLFNTHTCTAGNNDFLTACASYDAVECKVSGTLKALRFCEDGSTEEIDYALNAVERKSLGQRMEEYCQQQTGMSLAEYSVRAGVVRANGIAPTPQPITGFDLMEAYALQCVSELVDKIGGLPKAPEEESDPGQDAAPGTQGMKPMM